MSIKIEDSGTTTKISIYSADTVNVQTYRATNVANLKTIQGTKDGQVIELLGYYENGDGGGGTLYWDASSTETANDGTIFQATGVTTGRWKRLNKHWLSAEEFGLVGDGSTNNTDRFEIINPISQSSDKPIVFGVGEFLINGDNTRSFDGLNIIGQGKEHTKIYNTSGSITDFARINDGGDVYLENIHISGYRYSVYFISSADNCIVNNCKFTNNKDDVFYSKSPEEDSNAVMDRVDITNCEFSDTLGIDLRSKVNGANITQNEFKDIGVNTNIWGAVDFNITIHAVRIGVAFDSTRTLDWDVTQANMQNINVSNNSIDTVSVSTSSDIVLRGIAVTGNNVVISNNTIKNIINLNDDDESATAIYVKVYNGVISNNTIINCGSASASAISIKGYYRDGTTTTEDLDVGTDGRHFNVNIIGNTLYTDRSDLKNAIGLLQGEYTQIKNNTIDGYQYGINGIGSYCHFSGNNFYNITEYSHFSSSGSKSVDHSVIENENIVNISPTTNRFILLTGKGWNNCIIRNITIDADLTDYLSSSFTPITVQPFTPELSGEDIDNLHIDNIYLNLRNSSLSGSNFSFLSGNSFPSLTGFINNVKIITDGSETWRARSTNSEYLDFSVSNFYVNGLIIKSTVHQNKVRYTEEYVEIVKDLTDVGVGSHVLATVLNTSLYIDVEIWFGVAPTSAGGTAAFSINIGSISGQILSSTVASSISANDHLEGNLDGTATNSHVASGENDIILNVTNEELTAGRLYMKLYYISR